MGTPHRLLRCESSFALLGEQIMSILTWYTLLQAVATATVPAKRIYRDEGPES